MHPTLEQFVGNTPLVRLQRIPGKTSNVILAKLEENAREHGLKAMKLETGTLQPEALGLFARYGFTPCGPYADYPTDDPYSVFMEKQIS